MPTRATRKVTPAEPTKAKAVDTGVSAVAKASRPQGNPPNGTLPRSCSTPTHTVAAQTGHHGSRATSTVAVPPIP